MWLNIAATLFIRHFLSYPWAKYRTTSYQCTMVCTISIALSPALGDLLETLPYLSWLVKWFGTKKRFRNIFLQLIPHWCTTLLMGFNPHLGLFPGRGTQITEYGLWTPLRSIDIGFAFSSLLRLLLLMSPIRPVSSTISPTLSSITVKAPSAAIHRPLSPS